MQFFDFLKREAPGFDNAYMVDIPPQVGIRETRRVTGAYVLSGEDVLVCASFDDTIGVNGWPIEAHTEGRVEWRWPAIPQITWLQSPALPHAAAAEGAEPVGRRPLRLDDP